MIGALTAVILVGPRNYRSAPVLLDFAALQADAEREAAGTRDPVRLFRHAVLERIQQELDITLPTRDSDSLGQQLTRLLFDGVWPPTLECPVGSVADRADHSAEGRAPRVPAAPDPTYVPFAADTRNLRRPIVAPSNARPIGRSTPALIPLPEGLFDWSRSFPLTSAQEIYERLVGLDDVKARLLNQAVVLTQPHLLSLWAIEFHGTPSLRALAGISYSTPLILFAGDVGTGKSALAESFGDAVARHLSAPVHLLRLSVQTRGSGIVGDMTRRISEAFRHVERVAISTGQVTILLLDEADALAETRETSQMHHEDRAGVNALIQGIDQLRASTAPILVVFCSNRADQIDPAVRRRAVDLIEFSRPDTQQRGEHLRRLLGDLPFNELQWDTLVELTGPRSGRTYGCTYSDLSDRLVRQAVLSAFPSKPLSFTLLHEAAERLVPTRPFLSGDAPTV